MTELTLLSPPETARMLAVMDQLTCHTTSLNLCSSLGDHVLPEASSQVQTNTRPSWEKKPRVRRWGRQASPVTSSPSASVLGLFRDRGREPGQTTAKDLLAVSSFDNRFPARHPCLYPFSPEHASGWAGVSQVPFLIPVSGMGFVNTAVSQMFPGTFPHVPSHLLVLVSSSPVLSQRNGYRCLKSQAQRMRSDQKTTQKYTHTTNQNKTIFYII